MALASSQAANFISRTRECARDLIKLKDELTSLTDAYNSLAMSTDLNQTHFNGDNLEIVIADFNAAIAVLGSTNTTLKAGNPSNMTKLIKIT